jgi:transcriptional regulator with XRE-family HTH domain
MKMKSLRTGVAAAMGGAVLMAGLLVGASLALADDTDEPDTTTQEETRGECNGFMKDRFHKMAGGLEDLAEELGLPLEEIREQLHDGATLEEIAEDLGVDLDQVFTDLRASALAEIDERVAAGDLTQEQGDSIKERFESFEPGEGPFGARPDRGMRDIPGFLGNLDIDLDGLRELIESGATLEDALADLGVDVDALLSDALENAATHIDELVADGRITQERADEMKERLDSFELGEGFPFGPRGSGHDGFRSPRGHGFFDDPSDGANAEGALLDV